MGNITTLYNGRVRGKNIVGGTNISVVDSTDTITLNYDMTSGSSRAFINCYWFEVTSNPNTYLRRGNVTVAEDWIRWNCTLKDIYINNTAGSNHVIQLRKNGTTIKSYTLTSSQNNVSYVNENISFVVNDRMSFYYTGSKPTNEQMFVIMEPA